MEAIGIGVMVSAVIVVWFLVNTIKILKQYERGVIFTLGKVPMEGGVKGPGMIILIPGIQKMVRVSLRTVTMDVPSQDVITRDNVTVKVNAVVYFRVIDPRRAIVEVEDFYYATSLISQTTLRSILGQNQFDDLLSNRESINAELQKVIDEQTEPWGVKVTAVEVRNVDLPAEMQRAIAIQAQAERERRAKIIHAEGELQASTKLGGRRCDQQEPDSASAAIPSDPDGDRRGKELDYHLSPAHRPVDGIPENGRKENLATVTQQSEKKKRGPAIGRSPLLLRQ